MEREIRAPEIKRIGDDPLMVRVVEGEEWYFRCGWCGGKHWVREAGEYRLSDIRRMCDGGGRRTG